METGKNSAQAFAVIQSFTKPEYHSRSKNIIIIYINIFIGNFVFEHEHFKGASTGSQNETFFYQ